MFCIINLRHNSTYVAPPAAGGPPFFSTHAPSLSGRRYLYIHQRACARSVVLYTAPSNTIKSKHCNDVVRCTMNKDAAATRFAYLPNTRSNVKPVTTKARCTVRRYQRQQFKCCFINRSSVQYKLYDSTNSFEWKIAFFAHFVLN